MKNKNNLKIIIGAIIVVLIVIILAVLLINRDSSQDNKNSSETNNETEETSSTKKDTISELNDYKFYKVIDGEDTAIFLINDNTGETFSFLFENDKVTMTLYSNKAYENIQMYYSLYNWYIVDSSFTGSDNMCTYTKHSYASGELVGGDNCPEFNELDSDKYSTYLRIEAFKDIALEDFNMTIEELIEYVTINFDKVETS